MSDSLVLFGGEYYLKIDDSIRSYYGLSTRTYLAAILFCYHEQILLDNCSIELKTVIYRIYPDDSILLFRSKGHIKKFIQYWNCQHPNMKFTFQADENDTYPFLGINVWICIKKGRNFCASGYRRNDNI